MHMRIKKARRRKRNSKKTSNRILILLGVFILLFIITMIVTFWVKGSVPDTLIQYVLGAGGVEALLLAAIKISKVIATGKEIKNDQSD